MNKLSMLKLSVIAAALTLASTSTLHAQALYGRAEIKVPFAFEVGRPTSHPASTPSAC